MVKVDLRGNVCDVITVTIRGMPAGQIVTDKTDSVTIARRLLPESLKYDKEPSTIVRNMEQLGTAYSILLMEVRSAISHGSVIPLTAFIRKLDATNDMPNQLPGDGHLFVSNREVRPEAADNQPHQPLSP